MTHWVDMIDQVLSKQAEEVVAWAQNWGGSETERNLVLQTAVRTNNRADKQRATGCGAVGVLQSLVFHGQCVAFGRGKQLH